MSRGFLLSIVAIIFVVLLATLLLLFQQVYYWQLLGAQASGELHTGSYLGPSARVMVAAAALGAFPMNIPAILKLVTLLAGVALIVTTRRQLAVMARLANGEVV